LRNRKTGTLSFLDVALPHTPRPLGVAERRGDGAAKSFGQKQKDKIAPALLFHRLCGGGSALLGGVFNAPARLFPVFKLALPLLALKVRTYPPGKGIGPTPQELRAAGCASNCLPKR